MIIMTIGVDVSKSFLNIADSLSTSFRCFENSDASITAVLETFR